MNHQTPTLSRPFYFVAVVWGRQYRDYFLEYCLPSLLAPGNIPAITGRRPTKYLFATTVEDWHAMQRTAIFGELVRQVPAVFLELPPCPADRPYWMQNIIGHRLCCDLVFQDGAYRIFTSPDAVFSDGAVTRMHELALIGAEVVLKLTVPAVEEEPFFSRLAEMGILPEISARDSGRPLVFSGRQLASAALQSMHSMFIVNEWQAPYFCGYASTPWWRVPGEDGIVVCGRFWDVLLIDYGAVKLHDSAILDDRGWDGDYIMCTVGALETIYLVRDSDDINLISWSSSEPARPLLRHRFGEVGKGVEFRASYYAAALNSLHRQLLFFPTRIHGGPVNEKWDAIEGAALRTLLTWVDRPRELEKLSRRLPPGLRNYAGIESRIAGCRLPWWRRNALTWTVCRLCLMPLVAHLPRIRSRIKSVGNRLLSTFSAARVLGYRINLALQGDKTAIRWWRWRLRKLAADAQGRPFDESRPPSPK